MKKDSLGKGISALIPQETIQSVLQKKDEYFAEINIDYIETNPYQPRQDFDEEEIINLAESIKKFGLIHPIIVKKINDNKYQLIAGERRYRAAKLANLKTIPTIVKNTDNESSLKLSLIENIHRKDLNPIEIAFSYKRLVEEFNLTQEQISNIVGKDRATIANFLRLLKLPIEIQAGLKNNLITVGHAKALLSITDNDLQLKLYNDIIKYNYSVRKIEEIIKNILENKISEKNKYSNAKEYNIYKKMLEKKLNSKVEIKKNKFNELKITLHIKNEEVLKNIVDILVNSNDLQ